MPGRASQPPGHRLAQIIRDRIETGRGDENQRCCEQRAKPRLTAIGDRKAVRAPANKISGEIPRNLAYEIIE